MAAPTSGLDDLAAARQWNERAQTEHTHGRYAAAQVSAAIAANHLALARMAWDVEGDADAGRWRNGRRWHTAFNTAT